MYRFIPLYFLCFVCIVSFLCIVGLVCIALFFYAISLVRITSFPLVVFASFASRVLFMMFASFTLPRSFLFSLALFSKKYSFARSLFHYYIFLSLSPVSFHIFTLPPIPSPPYRDNKPLSSTVCHIDENTESLPPHHLFPLHAPHHHSTTSIPDY